MAQAPCRVPTTRRGEVLVVSSRQVFAAIRAEVEARGLDRPRPGRIAGELLFHFTTLVVATSVFFALEPGWQRGPAWLAIAVATVGITTNSHTSAHHGTSPWRSLDRALAWIGFPLLAGISLVYSRQKHREHHAATNIEDEDPDHDFAPFLALSAADLTKGGALSRAWYRIQWIGLPWIALAMVPMMRLRGWIFALALLRDRRRRFAAVADLGLMLLSAGIFWALPLLFFPWQDVVWVAVARGMLASVFGFAILVPAHLTADSVFFRRGAAPDDFLLHQLLTTVDFRVGPLAALYTAGLQYQIEHHLFPTLSYPNLPAVAEIVERHCRAAGLPYRRLGWGEALWATAQNLAYPKDVAASHEATRDGWPAPLV